LNRKVFRSPKLWLFDFLQRCSKLEATVLAVTFWHLWDTRNILREEGVQVNPINVAMKIKAYIELIISQLPSLETDHRRGTSRAVSWSPPPEGFLMINVDAALFSSSNCMGAGVVIRNHVGDFAGACGDYIHNVSSPELAEALAIRSVVIFASEEGMDNLIIASDCLSVVQSLNAKGMDRSAYGPVIHDIKSMMASFSACSIRHVSRLQNVAAHRLARSLEFSRRSVWRCVPPECIRETLRIDIMSGD
jgi:hypothetical protein